MFEYYDRRAPEYDEWYLGTGLFAAQERPGWHEELAELCVCEGLEKHRLINLQTKRWFL